MVTKRCLVTGPDNLCLSNFFSHLRVDTASLPSVRKAYAISLDVNEMVAQGPMNQQTYYTVKEGDTLTFIANKFNTSLQSLAHDNGISNPDYILAGKVLVIYGQMRLLNEAVAKSDEVGSSSCIVGPVSGAQPKMYNQMGGSMLMPMLMTRFSIDLVFVKTTSFLLIFLVLAIVIKRILAKFEINIHMNVLKRLSEKEIYDIEHRPKLRRWQKILHDNQKFEEADYDDTQAIDKQEQVEEEKLRQYYTQLESAYAHFLAESGLRQSGYWRGGLPSATKED